MALSKHIIVLLLIEVGVCSLTTVQPTAKVDRSADSKDSASSESEETESYENEIVDYDTIRNEKCANYHCPDMQECVMDVNWKPYCSCDLDCAEIYEPVCGTDGKTYSNNCKLTLASCDAEHGIHLIYKGECGSLKSTGWYLLMKIALPTGIVATVVFLCLIVCWCKKGAEYNYSCCPPSFPRYHEDEFYTYNHSNAEPIIPVQYNNGPISTVTIQNEMVINSNHSADSQQHAALLSSMGRETPPPSYEEATRS